MELEATDSEKKQLSYSTQFFGFTPDAFVDSITAPSIEIINEHLDVSIYTIEFVNFLQLRKKSNLI